MKLSEALQVLSDGLKEALATLTIIPSNTVNSSPRHHAAYLLSFPIVGLTFGILAMFLVHSMQASAAIVLAWCIPILWWILSGGKHLSELCRLANAISAQGNVNARREFLSREALLCRGVIIPLVLVPGKFFVLLQAENFPIYLLQSIVLVTPIAARYTAVILAIGSDSPSSKILESSKTSKTLLVLLVSVFTFAVCCSVSLAVGLAAIIGALSAGLVFRAVVDSRLGTIPTSTISASIELSELAALLVPILLVAFGVKL